LSSHKTASRSKWFVGSSNIRSLGCRKRAFAKLIRIRQPPENCTTGLSIENRSSSGEPFVKPRPQRIFLTLASAESAPIASSSAEVLSNSVRVLSTSSALMSFPCSISVSMSSSFCRSSASLLINSAALRSAARTSSTADRSVALASCSTRITSQLTGTGISRAAICRSRVVFP